MLSVFSAYLSTVSLELDKFVLILSLGHAVLFNAEQIEAFVCRERLMLAAEWCKEKVILSMTSFVLDTYAPKQRRSQVSLTFHSK